MKTFTAKATFSDAAESAFADKETARTLANKVLAARSSKGSDSFVVGRFSFTSRSNSALGRGPGKK